MLCATIPKHTQRLATSNTYEARQQETPTPAHVIREAHMHSTQRKVARTSQANGCEEGATGHEKSFGVSNSFKKRPKSDARKPATFPLRFRAASKISTRSQFRTNKGRARRKVRQLVQKHSTQTTTNKHWSLITKDIDAALFYDLPTLR